MSNDDTTWVREASDVLGEGTNEGQASAFQITMPYVVLQIMQRLEPNHSVQVSATGSEGMYYHGFSCLLLLLGSWLFGLFLMVFYTSTYFLYVELVSTVLR